MRFSVWPSYERTWEEVLGLATVAEASGWHGLWYADHLMSNTDDDSPGAGPAHEGWTMLAAVAAAVPRLRLTSMVSPVTIHHPVLLAKRACTVDRISGGRVTLGIGAGWQVNEHASYGFQLPEPKERVDRFDEAIQVIQLLLRDPAASFEGRWFTLQEAPCEPKPVQRPLPVLVGTGSPRMLRITARHADEWNTWGDPAQVRERTSLFERACEAEDRDPSTVRRSVQALVFLTDDDATTAKLRDRAPAGRSLVGRPSELVDLVGEYVAQGVDEMAVPDFTLGDSPAARAESCARFWEEVAAEVVAR